MQILEKKWYQAPYTVSLHLYKMFKNRQIYRQKIDQIVWGSGLKRI